MRFWSILVLYVQVQVIVSSAILATPELEGDPPAAWERLRQVMATPFAPIAPEETVSLRCREQSQRYLNDLTKLSPWALNMYDASTKVPTGIITGNIQQLGNLDQCLRVESGPDGGQDVIKGQLCSATVVFQISGFPTNATDDVDIVPLSRSLLNKEKVADMQDLLQAIAIAAGIPDWKGPQSAPYQWSYCVPASCRPNDVAMALSDVLAPLNVPGRVQVSVSVPENQCFNADQSYQLKGADIAFISVLGTVALLLILSTGYDVLRRNQSQKSPETRQKVHSVLASFSLMTNAKSVFNTNHSRDTFKCITGMRVITLFWVIYGHGYYMEAISPLLNSSDVRLLKNDWKKMIIMNGTISTDTFFLISGTLLCYIFLRERSRKTPFNIGIFYLHRYLRLFSPYAALIFFNATLFFYMGTGPLWNTWNGTIRDNCVINWWTNLLYVNNYIDLSRPCMDHTWYLAIDMQLFWLSPIILYPLARWPRVGKVLLVIAMTAAVVTPFCITFFHKLAGAMLYTTTEMVGTVFVEIYTKAYNRAGPYLIGIGLGYLLWNTRKNRVALSKTSVAVCWASSISLCLTVLFGTYGMYQSNHRYDAVEASAYAALHRPIWALGVAWVIFACIQGYGGFVNDILSWKLFLPLSRLSYCAYLCHFVVLLYSAGMERTSDYLNTYNVILKFLGHLPVILLLSTILSLCFEVPFLNLEKILLSSSVQSYSTAVASNIFPTFKKSPNDLGDSIVSFLAYPVYLKTYFRRNLPDGLLKIMQSNFPGRRAVPGKGVEVESICEMKSGLSSIESVQDVVSQPEGVTVISDLINRASSDFKTYDNNGFATR